MTRHRVDYVTQKKNCPNRSFIKSQVLACFEITVIIIIMTVVWPYRRKLADQSGDDREISFLFQRLSVLIQRYNAILLHDCFVKEEEE